MPQIERTIDIERSPGDVFSALTDLKSVSLWAANVAATYDAPDQPLKVGDEFRQRISLAGMEVDAAWRVTELDAPHRIAYESTQPIPHAVQMAQTVAAQDGGSRVSLQIEYNVPPGPLGVLVQQANLEDRAGQEAEASLRNLKGWLEGSLPTALRHPRT